MEPRRVIGLTREDDNGDAKETYVYIFPEDETDTIIDIINADSRDPELSLTREEAATLIHGIFNGMDEDDDNQYDG